MVRYYKPRGTQTVKVNCAICAEQFSYMVTVGRRRKICNKEQCRKDWSAAKAAKNREKSAAKKNDTTLDTGQ